MAEWFVPPILVPILFGVLLGAVLIWRGLA
jgi:hypothetical protein